MDALERSMTALGLFKDWSNYLLVTTVAAIGWVGTRTRKEPSALLQVSLWLLAISAVLGIFTLALLPLLAQEVKKRCDGSFTSIYRTQVTSSVFSIPVPLYLTQLCRPQHVTFILGLLAYAAAEAKMNWDLKAVALVLSGAVVIAIYGAFSHPDRAAKKRPRVDAPASGKSASPSDVGGAAGPRA